MSKLIRAISENGGAVLSVLDSTEIVAQMEVYHHPSAVVSAALGRLLTGAVLMAATLGAQVDRLIAAAQVTDMARAVVLDCCATAAIESYCDEVQRGLEREKAAGEETLCPAGT